MFVRGMACAVALWGIASFVEAAGPAHLIKDLETAPLIGGSYPQGFFGSTGTVYFSANNRDFGLALWKTDGTEAGTVPLKTASPISSDMAQIGSTIFFAGGAPDRGWALCKTDGTPAGTVVLKEFQLSPSADNSNESEPVGLRAFGSSLLFFVNDGVHGLELWKSDGTEAGTILVKDTLPGPADGIFTYGGSAVFCGRFYFLAWDGPAPRVWQSDGTEAGTVPWVAPGGADPAGRAIGVIVAGYRLCFMTNGGYPLMSLWITDGTPGGTHHLFDGPSNGSFGPVDAGGTLYFVADDGVHGTELWKSDGTEAGTHLVKDIFPGDQSSFSLTGGPTLVSSGGTLYFNADDGSHGQELWKSDGTEGGTRLVRDIVPGADSSYPFVVADVAGTLLFAASDPVHGLELWRGDGTEAGTVAVRADAAPGLTGWALMPSGRGVILPMDDGVHGMELWRSDGTAAGTSLVKDIDPFVGTWGSGPSGLVPVGDKVVFYLAGAPYSFYSLGPVWSSNGSEQGTVDLGGVLGSLSFLAVNAGGRVFFDGGEDFQHGIGLWRTDGTPSRDSAREESVRRRAVLRREPGPAAGRPALLRRDRRRARVGALDQRRQRRWNVSPERPQSRPGQLESHPDGESRRARLVLGSRRPGRGPGALDERRHHGGNGPSRECPGAIHDVSR
jgi:ELWxxDGT repeat protein